ncbi:TPA: hypothetical protein ROX87_005684 [Bacillus thuringiensis]|uniref:DUF2712 domain-containing protein n=1 Tax=Bacillus thuringiensis TaxID=1428 RepID=UPI000BF67E8D|nr:DUF2712 domain-containing protein [Bacillus thuringiensis]PER38955.1 hypothetical protein CN472_30945 [Bacillus thuringiensis]HDX9536145.1 hypothetical protein [Bacillus thuringiensis]
MKKTFKKVILAGALLGFVVTNTNLDIASANNSDDSEYYMKWPAGGLGVRYTSDRAKEDKTSSYIKAEWIGNGRQLYVWVADSDYNDRSGGHKYFVSAGEARKLANVVKEEGRNYARLAANLKGTSRVSIASGGVWSPDSR